MSSCKHYLGVTSEQIEELGRFVAGKLNSAAGSASQKEIRNDLKLSVVYDPLKKVLKVSLKEKPAELPEIQIWEIIDQLLIEHPNIYPV